MSNHNDDINMFDDNVVEPTIENPQMENPPQMVEQTQMEQGGDVTEYNSASMEGEPPIQEMEQGGVIDDGRVIVDWGLVFTFFK